MKVGIVDDNFLNRKIIRDKLQPYSQIRVVLEADNGESFFEELENLSLSEFPDIVLMDLEMPFLDGISAISISKIKYPEIKFIVLTIYEDYDRIFEAIKAGANGYLLKEEKAVDIVKALESVLNFDNIPMSPAIARSAMKLLSGEALPNENSSVTPDYNLSERETDVLKLMINGLTYIQIGEKLFISPHTVRTHINNIYRKLHLNSRTQVMNLAHRKKWL